MKDFAHGKKIEVLYTDRAPVFDQVCKLEKILPEHSQPGVPQTNGIIERTNQDIVVGTRALLAQAGLPACVRVFAAPSYCLMDNITPRPNGDESPWKKKYGQEFEGLRLPFGCKVTLAPAPTKVVKPGRWDMPTRTGIFAGYVQRIEESLSSCGHHL